MFSLTSHSRSLKSERPLPPGRTLSSSIILRRVAAWSSSQPSSMSRGETAPEPGTRMCCTGHSALSLCQAQGNYNLLWEMLDLAHIRHGGMVRVSTASKLMLRKCFTNIHR